MTPASPDSALLTDLYQLTMVQAYHEHAMEAPASFELFVRKLPSERGFLVAAGLEQALDYLEGLAFTEAELAWLAEERGADPGFVDFLARLRFEGDVDAVPEGSLVFPDEPLLRVTAPMPQAQLVETRLINLLQFQTLIASKAARCVLAAPGRLLVDFGLRRSHGAEAGLLAARAAYLAGFDATSTVLAGQRFGIPVSGTMAHSFVQAYVSERRAFLDFARSHPDNVVLLIDTYDTEQGAREVVALAPQLRAEGIAVRAVRIDSGDLGAHARTVRRILDEGGLGETTIFASGDLDEHGLEALIAAGAPIDGFGVGTRLDTSEDAPYLNCAYKLVEYNGHPRRKRSESKQTWAGRKQVLRHYDGGGRLARDVLAAAGERLPGQPLLEPVMRGGRRLRPDPALEHIRERARAELDRLPDGLRSLRRPAAYPVEPSEGLRALSEQADREIAAGR